MRHLYFVLMFTLIMHGCKDTNVNVKEFLVGNWELRKTISGENNVTKSFPTGKGITLTFTDTTYRQFSNGSMVSKGRYKIIKDTMESNGIISNRIVFKPEVYSWDSTRYFIGFEKNQLVIGVDTIGALISYYERLK